MASSKNESYRSGKIGFSYPPGQRMFSGATDSKLVNCFIETLVTGKGEVLQEHIVERPGVQHEFQTSGSIPRGLYCWGDSVYTVNNDQLQKDGVSIATVAGLVATVGWVEFLTDTNQRYLIMLDGLNGYVIKTDDTVTQITDVDFPSPHLTKAVFIDGYLVVAKANTGDVYNSNLNDPLSWTAGNYITAEMYADNLRGLMKQANYVVAFGDQSIEYFYDEGNATGSPFARNPSAFHKVGAGAAGSLAAHEETIYFVGNSTTGEFTVYKLDGFELSNIGTHEIIRALAATNAGDLLEGYVINIKGHSFYVLTIGGVGGLPTRCFMYDIRTNIWHEWQNAAGTDFFPWYTFASTPNGTVYCMHANNGDVGVLRDDIATDSTFTTTTTIKMTAVTPPMEFGTMSRKFGNRFTLLCDIPTTPGNASITLEWSDDDYRSWSNARTVIINNVMNVLHQMGMFRRRAWRLTYNSPYPFRLEGAELLYNMGDT